MLNKNIPDTVVGFDGQHSNRGPYTKTKCGEIVPNPVLRNQEKSKDSTSFDAICGLIDKRPGKLINALHHKSRKRRTDGLESILLVAKAIGRLFESHTLTLGCFNSARLKPHTINDIAKKAGISFRRTQRALFALIKAGYMKAHRQYDRYENKDGGQQFLGLASIREISVQFFLDIGFSAKRLLKLRNDKYKKLKKIKRSTSESRYQRYLQELKNILQQSIDSAREKTFHGLLLIKQNTS